MANAGGALFYGHFCYTNVNLIDRKRGYHGTSYDINAKMDYLGKAGRS